MNEGELKVLLDAAQLARIPADGLKPVNPFSQNGNRASAMQMAVEEINPAQAARWRVEAGNSVSLAAAAAKAGLTEMNHTIHNELQQLDADYITGQQEASARREAELLASLEKGADDLAAAREKTQQSFARSAGKNDISGQANQQFLRQLGVKPSQLNNIPARRLLGK